MPGVSGTKSETIYKVWRILSIHHNVQSAHKCRINTAPPPRPCHLHTLRKEDECIFSTPPTFRSRRPPPLTFFYGITYAVLKKKRTNNKNFSRHLCVAVKFIEISLKWWLNRYSSFYEHIWRPMVPVCDVCFNTCRCRVSRWNRWCWLWTEQPSTSSAWTSKAPNLK